MKRSFSWILICLLALISTNAQSDDYLQGLIDHLSSDNTVFAQP